VKFVLDNGTSLNYCSKIFNLRKESFRAVTVSMINFVSDDLLQYAESHMDRDSTETPNCSLDDDCVQTQK